MPWALNYDDMISLTLYTPHSHLVIKIKCLVKKIFYRQSQIKTRSIYSFLNKTKLHIINQIKLKSQKKGKKKPSSFTSNKGCANAQCNHTAVLIIKALIDSKMPSITLPKTEKFKTKQNKKKKNPKTNRWTIMSKEQRNRQDFDDINPICEKCNVKYKKIIFRKQTCLRTL